MNKLKQADKNLTRILNPIPAKKRQYDQAQDEILNMINGRCK